MNIDWIEGATHYGIGDDCPVFFRNIIKGESYEFKNVYSSGIMADWLECTGYIDIQNGLVERPKKQEAWDGEGLPPVGLDVLAKVDFKKAPPYTIINLTEIGIDVQNSMPSFQKAKVLYASEKYVILLARGVECMAPRSCVEFEKIKTAEKLAEEEKVAAIAEMQSVVMAASGCTVSTISECLAIVALYEAGYRKQ